jgi:hypothetical protein
MKATKILLFTIIWLPAVLLSCNDDETTSSVTTETISAPTNVTVTEMDQMVKLKWTLNVDKNCINTLVVTKDSTVKVSKYVDSLIIKNLVNDTQYKFKLVSLYSNGKVSDTVIVTGTPTLQVYTILGNGMVPGNYYSSDSVYNFHFIDGISSQALKIDTANNVSIVGSWSKGVGVIRNIFSAYRKDAQNNVISRPDFSFNNMFTFVNGSNTYFAFNVLQKYEGSSTKLPGSYSSSYVNVEHSNNSFTDPISPFANSILTTDSAKVYTITSRIRDLKITENYTWSYTDQITVTYYRPYFTIDPRYFKSPVLVTQSYSATGKWSLDDIRNNKFFFVSFDIKANPEVFLISAFEKLFTKK